jgi:hypothetical protein
MSYVGTNATLSHQAARSMFGWRAPRRRSGITRRRKNGPELPELGLFGNGCMVLLGAFVAFAVAVLMSPFVGWG